MADLWARWSQLGAMIFFGGFALWAIIWAGRSLRAMLGEKGTSLPRSELSQEAVDAIVSRGLATPVQLFSMTAQEQRVLAQTAIAMVTATQMIPGGVADDSAPAAHCPHCGKLVRNFPGAVPWKCTCEGCGSTLLLWRDGGRLVFSYTPIVAGPLHGRD